MSSAKIDGQDSGDTSWIMMSTTLVMFMTPGLAFFYGGFVSEKAIVNTMMLSFGTMGVVSLLWALVGYSLAFAPSISSGAVGDLSLALLDFPDQLRVGTSTNEHAYMMYQCMFAVITPAVISGAVVTRMRYNWFMAFVGLWSIFVYCPLAHWVWAPSGWLYQLGLLDFAGGTVVESASGVSAFVLAFWLGASPKRHTVNPHNVPYILLGAAILWFGWFGFNAGGGLTSTAYGARLMANTHMAASSAMMTWGVLEWAFPLNAPFFSGRPTSIGAACGAVVGLVAITPACGYVTIMWGIFIAFFAAICVFFVQRNIKVLGVDDRLDVFAFHGVAGMVGTALTGLFATTSADSPVDGAFYGSRGKQFAVQLAGISTTILLCTVGTTVIFHALALLARALGQDMRISHTVEDIDASQHGESAYYFEENSSRGIASTAVGLLTSAAPEPSALPSATAGFSGAGEHSHGKHSHDAHSHAHGKHVTISS
jgi:Amt family ammonium transporter